MQVNIQWIAHHQELQRQQSLARRALDSPSPYTPTPGATFPVDDDQDDDAYVDVPQRVFNLPEENRNAIRECIRDITLPTWVGRPPVNLGEASHGKLKAYEYLILFSSILPLVVPEFWHRPASSEVEQMHLESFHNLVVATNIVCSFRTSNADADLYTHRYTLYREGIQRLFAKWAATPNHHYAMHNGAHLKYWGPLAPLSEFPGERLIGMLQKINTNQKIRKYPPIIEDSVKLLTKHFIRRHGLHHATPDEPSGER